MFLYVVVFLATVILAVGILAVVAASSGHLANRKLQPIAARITRRLNAAGAPPRFLRKLDETRF